MRSLLFSREKDTTISDDALLVLFLFVISFFHLRCFLPVACDKIECFITVPGSTQYSQTIVQRFPRFLIKSNKKDKRSNIAGVEFSPAARSAGDGIQHLPRDFPGFQIQLFHSFQNRFFVSGTKTGKFFFSQVAAAGDATDLFFTQSFLSSISAAFYQLLATKLSASLLYPAALNILRQSSSDFPDSL